MNISIIPDFIRSFIILWIVTTIGSFCLWSHEPSPTEKPIHNTSSFDSISTAWAVIQEQTRIVQSFILNKNLSSIHDAEEKISVAIQTLQEKSAIVEEDKRKRLQAALKQLAVFILNVHEAADADNLSKTESEFKKYQDALKLVEAQYSPELLKNVTKTQAQPTNHSIEKISSKIVLTHPLIIGEINPAQISFRFENGNPVSLEDLKEIYTEKIHLLLIDSSLTDCHHVYPQPTDQPGTYSFSFIPQKPGTYHLWANLHVSKSDQQQFVKNEIPASTSGESLSNHNISMETVLGNLKCTLSFDPSVLKVDQPAMGRVSITDDTGQSFDRLEPLKGAFAHIIGFNEDLKTAIYIHRSGENPIDPKERGIGELQFHLTPEKSGLWYLFIQVQIDGKSRFAPFTVKMLP